MPRFERRWREVRAAKRVGLPQQPLTRKVTAGAPEADPARAGVCASGSRDRCIGWGVILYAAGPLTLGHVLYYKGVSVVGAGRAAIFMNLIPFLVIGLSWFFLGERVYWYHLVGATAAIGGVALATSK